MQGDEVHERVGEARVGPVEDAQPSVVVRDVAEVEVAVDQGLRELEGRQLREPALGPGQGRADRGPLVGVEEPQLGAVDGDGPQGVPGRVEPALGEPGRAQLGQVG